MSFVHTNWFPKLSTFAGGEFALFISVSERDFGEVFLFYPNISLFFFLLCIICSSLENISILNNILLDKNKIEMHSFTLTSIWLPIFIK